MPDTYVHLPDGRYVHVPANASPDQLSALRTRLSAFQQPTSPTSALSKATGLSAEPQSAGGRVLNDLRYGTSTSAIGNVLKRMGAKGTSSGEPEAVGEFMGSVPLGAARVAKGVPELTSRDRAWQGAKDIVGGIMQTLTIPSMVMTPEASGVAASKASEMIPSATRAGKNFEAVARVANKHAVDMTDKLGQSLLRIQQLAERGGSGSNFGPVPIRKFFQRVTNPEMGPLTYEEARDFYSNVSRLSADEMNRLTPPMKRAVAQFARDLGDTITTTATHAGKGEQYLKAMSEYAKSMRLRDFMDDVKKAGIKALPWGAAGAAGTAGALITKHLLEP